MPVQWQEMPRRHGAATKSSGCCRKATGGPVARREELAWAFVLYSDDYVDQQEEARTANRGVHAHDCAPAWEWRAQQRTRSGQ
jgi:hypothetical protein